MFCVNVVVNLYLCKMPKTYTNPVLPCGRKTQNHNLRGNDRHRVGFQGSSWFIFKFHKTINQMSQIE